MKLLETTRQKRVMKIQWEQKRVEFYKSRVDIYMYVVEAVTAIRFLIIQMNSLVS